MKIAELNAAITAAAETVAPAETDKAAFALFTSQKESAEKAAADLKKIASGDIKLLPLVGMCKCISDPTLAPRTSGVIALAELGTATFQADFIVMGTVPSCPEAASWVSKGDILTLQFGAQYQDDKGGYVASIAKGNMNTLHMAPNFDLEISRK